MKIKQKMSPWISVSISLTMLVFLFSCATGTAPGAIDSKTLRDSAVSGALSPIGEISVSGRVLYNDSPVSKAAILAYKDITGLSKDDPAAYVLTDDDGNYTLRLSPGRYFFTARKNDSLFSYSGRNPVNLVMEEDYWIGFLMVNVIEVKQTDYEDEFSSSISGTVLHDGTSVNDAFVTIFLDDSDDFKGPGYSITSTDANGEFFFDYLPESEYYILVRKRRSGEKVGPIYEDDLFGYFPGNPLKTVNGKTTHITIDSVAKVADKRAAITALPDTGFSGRVLDTNGAPVKGMHVFAYTDPVIGHKRPSALSLATKEDGNFVVELKKGGTYYIGARERHGDSPVPGELFGMYDVTDDHGIIVETGSFLKNIDITVEEIMMK